MNLFRRFLARHGDDLVERDIRLSVIGRRDRLPEDLVQRIEHVERRTESGRAIHVRLAVDYSARHEIEAGRVGPDVDLLVRTGGEQRLSDFLLWECAYAELVFTGCPWPEFGETELSHAVHAFSGRQRRFGRVV